jgi:hypothetical protein
VEKSSGKFFHEIKLFFLCALNADLVEIGERKELWGKLMCLTVFVVMV